MASPWFGDFRDQVVVVTGASSGIGRETALAFGAVGARVVLVARRRSVLERVARVVRRNGGKALIAAADISRPAAVRQALDAARQHFGRIDLVVNNAGVLIPSTVAALRPADLTAMLRVNLFGALFVMQQATRIMQAQPDGGSIVNVASLAGRRGVSPLGGYCATKFALVGITEALRVELHESNVHVALVMPGVIETPMAHAVVDDEHFAGVWPSTFVMPAAWVVWAIFAAARFRLVEISVPPGAATLEKLAALAPGLADSLLHWSAVAGRFVSDLARPGAQKPHSR